VARPEPKSTCPLLDHHDDVGSGWIIHPETALNGLDLKGSKVLVLGLGDTGLSLTRWLVRRGASVHVADSRRKPPHADVLAEELPQVTVTCGGFDESDFRNAEMIAISPGVDPRQPLVVDAAGRGVPVVGDIELFARNLDAIGRPRVVAITGSNGKSTVATMTGEMCRSAGMRTVVAGNIGLPVLDALTAIEDGSEVPQIVVLELSSFQLESTSSLEADSATMLNLTEDHLDRYDSLADYAAAKQRVFAGSGVQVLNRDDPHSMAMAQSGRASASFGLVRPANDTEWGIRIARRRQFLAKGTRQLLQVEELPVAGMHNAANALAALALARALDLPEERLLEALRQFKGLPHRVQRITDIEGVTFYDDSKGTNVGATVAALNGMAQTVVLIAGGDGKGQDFSPLAPAVAARARAVVLIGRDSDAISKALDGCGVPLERAGNMQEAVEKAFHASRSGDAVLLSPACASYDMFLNYVHRAEAFVQAVHQFAGGRS
jgi:UDP-N-acetylmuramoylalanine--D-glutamate ligase